MDWLGIALGSMAIVMIRHLTGGGWGTVIRRMFGAAMRTLPVMFVLFIPIAIAVLQHQMYPWLHPERRDHRSSHQRTSREAQVHLQMRTCTPSGFIIRAIVYLAVWNLLSFLLSLWSKQTDQSGAPDNTQKFKAVAGPGLILYGFTISFGRHRLDHVARSQLGLYHLSA